jgi:hypothetical protein
MLKLGLLALGGLTGCAAGPAKGAPVTSSVTAVAPGANAAALPRATASASARASSPLVLRRLTLELGSNAEGANVEVTINGESKKFDHFPTTLELVPSGDAKLVARKAGFADRELPVVFPEGKSELTVVVEFPAERRLGGLSLQGRQEGEALASLKVRLVSVDVQGALPREVIMRIVRQNFGRFRLCYHQALENSAALTGKLTVRFVIGADGTVSRRDNLDSDLGDSALIGCVLKGFEALAFPRPDQGTVTVDYTLAFAPS